jgi:hypothetical protein
MDMYGEKSPSWPQKVLIVSAELGPRPVFKLDPSTSCACESEEPTSPPS